MAFAVGIRKEIKQGERRVVLTPHHLEGLIRAVEGGAAFLVEEGAGAGSDFSDGAYASVGAKIVSRTSEKGDGLFDSANVIVGVKELLPPEWPLVKEGQIHFAFFHFPASRELYEFLKSRRATAIAFEGIEETVRGGAKIRPILAQMSEVAAEYSILTAEKYFCETRKKSWQHCFVAIFGANGVLGKYAMRKAAEKNAFTVGFDISADPEETRKIISADSFLALRGKVIYPLPEVLKLFLPLFDIVIMGAASRNRQAPKILTVELISSLKPESLIVDPSIDEGGCTAISRATSHAEPVVKDTSIVPAGIFYCGVPNMPGGLPKMATEKISGVVSRYLLRLLKHVNDDNTFRRTILSDEALAKGFVLYRGEVVDGKIAALFGDEYVPLESLLK